MGMLLSSGDVQGAAFYLCRGYSSLMVVGGVYSTGTGGVSLFAVEGTLLWCNVKDLLSSCGGGSLSSIVRWASLLLWPWASLELWHKPPLKFRRGLMGPF